MLVLVKTRLKALHGCLPRKVDLQLASQALSLQAVHSIIWNRYYKRPTNKSKPWSELNSNPGTLDCESDTLTTRSRYLLFILLLLLFTVSYRRSFRCNQRKKTSGHKKGISLCIQHTWEDNVQEVLPAFPFKEIPVVYLYVGELGREREVRMSNLVHVAIADKSQVFSVEMVDCRRS